MTERFLEARQRVSDLKPICPKTVRSYRQGLAFFTSALSTAKWEEEIPRLVATVSEERLASGQISAPGINVYLRGLNSFLSWCHNVGFLRNRIKVSLLATKRRQRPKTLGYGEIEWWKTFNSVTLSQRRTKYMALMILDVGIRAEECLALQESDIELNTSRLWIGKGKGGANREVPLSSDGKKYLQQLLALTGQYRNVSGPVPVFLTKTGHPLTYRNSLRDLKKVAVRAGTPWVSWHSFRRTFATQYLRNGGLPTDLQQILGHKDIRTTMLYVGDGMDNIVALHDQYSPLSPTGKRTRKTQASRSALARTALPGRSRKW